MKTMTPRETAGAINRADAVYVWVQLAADHGAFFAVTKSLARTIVNEARHRAEQTGVAIEIVARTSRNSVFIGDQFAASRPITSGDESA